MEARLPAEPPDAAIDRSGMVIDAGPEAWPAHDPALESQRIQAAALVAQQSALFERELRVAEREAGLAIQEEQLAEHLEDKRRQLLDLQDQITTARDDLRQRRSEHELVAEEHEREWKQAREESARLMARAKAQRQRLDKLQRRLRERQRHERQALAAAHRQLIADRAELVNEREEHASDQLRRTSKVELDSRRLRAGWERLAEQRKASTERRNLEQADLQRRLRDLARRDKAVRSAEADHESKRDRLAKDLSDRRHEIERLETRIGHARQRLLDAQAGLVPAPAPLLRFERKPTGCNPWASARNEEQPDVAAEERTRVLAQIALDLGDQRLWLAEQTARLVQARERWLAERDTMAGELQSLAQALEDRNSALERGNEKLTIAEAQLHAETRALAQRQLQIEADRTRQEAALDDERRELARRVAELEARDRLVARREEEIADVLRHWGQRRRRALAQLDEATGACATDRSAWAAARDSWLAEYEHAVAERRDLAASALALEHARQEWLDARDRSPAAAKRIERLERRWVTQFTADVKQLDRLRETLSAEAMRLDEDAEAIRRERLAYFEQSAALDERAAALDADRAQLSGERLRVAATADDERSRRGAAELKIHVLQEEVEGLASLLIEAPSLPLSRAA